MYARHSYVLLFHSKKKKKNVCAFFTYNAINYIFYILHEYAYESVFAHSLTILFMYSGFIFFL